jgi:hypothetical protein
LVLDNTIKNTQWQNKLTDETITLTESVTLAPYSYMVLGK